MAAIAQPDAASVKAQLQKVVAGLRGRFAQAAELLEAAAEDVLAYLHFPAAHGRQLHSTNPLERLNKEINGALRWSGSFRTGRRCYGSSARC